MTTAKPILRTGMRMSVDEFLDLPETDDKPKLELDDGELIVMPRPRRLHQFFKDDLVRHFKNILDSYPVPPGEVYSELVVILSRQPRHVVIPDLAFILRERVAIFNNGYAEGPPDIVIEILSTNRERDLVRKRQLYAAAGVPEYWILDPRNDTVTQLELPNSQYVERAVLTADDTLTTPLLPGLAIPLADLFHHRQRPRDD